jgi:hypothetical protein
MSPRTSAGSPTQCRRSWIHERTSDRILRERRADVGEIRARPAVPAVPDPVVRQATRLRDSNPSSFDFALRAWLSPGTTGLGRSWSGCVGSISPTERIEFLADDYTQHAEGFGDGIERVKARYAVDVKPGASHVLTPRFYAADVNFVLSVVEIGRDLLTANFDLVRIANGKIAEHSEALSPSLRVIDGRIRTADSRFRPDAPRRRDLAREALSRSRRGVAGGRARRGGR